MLLTTSEQMLFVMVLFGQVVLAGIALLIAVTIDDPP
jgi:hypothetical protein